MCLFSPFTIQKDQFALEDSLSAGQVLAVVVVKASTESIPGGGGKTRKRIQVSALPSGLNDIEIKEKSVVRGRITSVEDHGCLVDLGHHKTGFLPFDQVEGDYSVTANDNNEDSTVRLLNPGRLYDFVVSSKHSASTKVVPLSLLCTEKLSHKTASSGDYTLQTLNPGMLVQARVEALARNGICVTFLGAFRGAIELSHLGTQFLATTKQQDGSSEWKQVFSSKKLQKFSARILAVDPVTKVVRLTLLPHLLDMKTIRDENESLPPVGTVVENATVIRLDPGVGALLALPSNDDDDTASASVKLWPPFSKTEQYRKGSNIKTAYVHISKALDGRTPEAEFSKTFAPSTTHTLRILNTSHLVDGIATCATADSVVQAHVLTHDDLEPGKVYRNVVVCGQLEGGSVMVDFGMGIRGLIPQMHLFDHSVTSEFRNRLKKEKFAIGTKVDVKCLSVDALHKRCLVTAKKSLLKASDNITAYQDVEPGQTATGFISKIDDKGLCVTFCNRVYGKVTARSLAAELGVENHHADYHVGDVVQCRVINCKKRQQSRGDEQWDLNLSLNLHKGDEDEEMEDIAPTHETSREVGLKAGAVLPEKSMRVVELVDSIPKEDGSFIPGHAIVRIKSKLLVNDTNAKFLPHVECKLPFDQLQDSYSEKEIESAEALDALAKRILTVGKKVEQKGLILSDPKKSTDEYASGLGRLPIVSLRPMLIATAETPSTDENTFTSPLLPTDDTHLFTGAFVQGYVTQVNPRHGSFVRFLNRVTGLVPKVKKGLNLPKYGTVTCRIVALDTSSSPPKILLTIASSKEKKDAKKSPKGLSPPVPTTSIKPGDVFHDATVVDFNFHRARINLGGDNADNSVRARIHVTMAEAPLLSCVVQSNKRKNKKKQKATDQKITKHHPFYKWKSGMKLPNLSCVAVDVHDGAVFVELTNRETTKRGNEPTDSPVFLESISKLVPGMKLPAVITSVSPKNTGIWVQTRPGMSGFIPALELSTDAAVLNNMGAYFPLGARIQVCVMDKDHWVKTKHRSHNEAETTEKDKSSGFVYVSVLQANEMNQDDSSMQIPKPIRGDLIVGRINRKIHPQRAPALMLDLRGGFVGRCCITELDEVDDWVNMPLGRLEESDSHPKKDSHNIVTDEEHEAEGHDDDEMEVDEDSDEENDHR
jgi:ribosomal protein S1